ncbi:hypothetical protein IFO69_20205 [Echinicola sp. CAU 1574]|uniref:Helix-turn-helix domain-containing protein n=1 Tax=Echinicola arenosa TaxID=2774144 RepID=A0ABR9AT93_9BACT|nr:hypothetical protein [Echinicola arenosa]MBD8491088.1 hypothetical protein [Echinicola arenosa]
MENLDKTLLIIDPKSLSNKFRIIEDKLDQLLSKESSFKEQDLVEYITAKKFMELVDMKSYNTLYKFFDRGMQHKKIMGKYYIHKNEIKKYFAGEFNSQK